MSLGYCLVDECLLDMYKALFNYYMYHAIGDM